MVSICKFLPESAITKNVKKVFEFFFYKYKTVKKLGYLKQYLNANDEKKKWFFQTAFFFFFFCYWLMNSTIFFLNYHSYQWKNKIFVRRRMCSDFSYYSLCFQRFFLSSPLLPVGFFLNFNVYWLEIQIWWKSWQFLAPRLAYLASPICSMIYHYVKTFFQLIGFHEKNLKQMTPNFIFSKNLSCY